MDIRTRQNRSWSTLTARSLACGLAFALSLSLAPDSGAAPIGAQEPTNQEQDGLYYLNRARSNPPGYGAEIGLNLDGVASRQALAVSRELTGSARFHAIEMLENDYFGHTSEVTGDGPNQMAVQHGYDVFGAGLGNPWGTANSIESIAAGVRLLPTYKSAIDLLIIDKGVAGLGHRVHLLATAPGFATHGEVGFGRAVEGQTQYYAIHTCYRSQADRFVTGVVFADANSNGRYDGGEGLGGVTVQVGDASVQTMQTGGYSILVAPGSYDVSCSGGDFVGIATAQVNVDARNVAVDFRQGLAMGEVDFAFQFGGGIPQPPTASITASVVTGSAPLFVQFDAVTGGEIDTHAWEFGDGSEGTGTGVSHTFVDPGLYEVSLRATGIGGTAASSLLVSVSGADGAGVGTTAPASLGITAKALKAKAKFNVAGKDVVQLKGVVELPAGFVVGATPVEVCVGGACMKFTLDEKGKGADEAGSKIKLKVPGRRGDPTVAGTTGKLTVKLKGDFGSALERAGVQNRNEKREVSGFSFAFLLGELGYRGAAPVKLVSKTGKKGQFTLIK